MSLKRGRLMKIAVLTAIGVLAVVLAPSAHADDEADYIRALSSSGFVFDGGGRTNMIELGHRVCSDLDQGVDAVTIGGWIQDSSTRMEGSTGPWKIVDTAIQHLCPQHMDQVPSLG
jgi:Protein of unknown function (DUF732)